jgi:hypothetical protein
VTSVVRVEPFVSEIDSETLAEVARRALIKTFLARHITSSAHGLARLAQHPRVALTSIARFAIGMSA